MPLYKKYDALTDQELGKSFATNVSAISQLSMKIASLLPKADLKPSLFARISRWVEQLSLLQRREVDLINKIVEVEEIHKKQRKNKLLKRTFRTPRPIIETDLAPAPPRRKGMWSFLIAMMILDSESKRSRPQLKNE